MKFLVTAAAWAVGLLVLAAAAFIGFGLLTAKPAARQEAQMICPPKISAAPRAPFEPVDDVLGLRAGFSLDDAQKTLLCRSTQFTFSFSPRWHTEVPKGFVSRQQMIAERSSERFTFGLVGPMKAETIYAIWQEIVFPDAPTRPPDALAADLARHYGPPHEDKDYPNRRDLWWLYDPQGRPLKPVLGAGADPFSAVVGWVAGTLTSALCKNHIGLDPTEHADWGDECGVTIHAEIEKRQADPTRVLRYRIVAVNQAKLSAAVTQYRIGLSATRTAH